MQSTNQLYSLENTGVTQISDTVLRSQKSLSCVYATSRKDLPQLSPLTAPFVDAEKRVLQLWKIGQKQLVGAVLDAQGRFELIPARKICNPLNPHESGVDLINRLEQRGLKRWDIAFEAHRKIMTIWPHLVAAGRYDKMNPDVALQDMNRRFNNIVYEGALNHTHYMAYRTEKSGKPLLKDGVPVLKKDGTPYDHIDDVKGHQNGAIKLITDVKQCLGRQDLSEKQRENVSKFLSKASNMLDHSKEVTQSADRKALQYTTSPSTKQFQQSVQTAKLTDTYNATHKHNPIPPKGTGGSIGGVACSTAYIKGLFDTAEALFEDQHLFCVPALADGKMPFSDAELGQILRELAIGIFTYGTVPFFSLHFNEDAQLYPIIHPVYEHTL
ncbi:MAG: hypothetical protein JSR46_09370, partial [Verrucomicrobia bacterium]|nr:hypothetical protein [Verrucomicrobiota bacterium]